MKKAKSKFISLLLIAVMLIHALPAGAVTAVSDTDAQITPSVSVVPNPDYVEPGAIRELESRREENVMYLLRLVPRYAGRRRSEIFNGSLLIRRCNYENHKNRSNYRSDGYIFYGVFSGNIQ